MRSVSWCYITDRQTTRIRHELSDAVVALDIASGRIVWTKQVTAGDIFNGSCRGRQAQLSGRGWSRLRLRVVGDSRRRARGRDLLLAGQKSGIVYALDPEKNGEIVWQTRVGNGGTNGGVQWGMSTDGELVYAAVSDPGQTRQNSQFDTRRFILDPKEGGGLTALRVADGSKVWYATPAACPDKAPLGCSPAQPGAVTSIPGVVFASSIDGHMRAYSAEDGAVLWDFDTAREFDTVNQVNAHGGSIDGPGAVVAKGRVFVTSGYPRNGGMTGNVLLVFEAN